MTKDDFKKSVSATGKSGQGSGESNSTKVVPLKPQGPQPPAPRPPMPKGPFGMHVMPVATNIKVLPDDTKGSNRHVHVVEHEDAEDDK